MVLFEILDEAKYGSGWRCPETALKLEELKIILVEGKESQHEVSRLPTCELFEQSVELWERISKDKSTSDVTFVCSGGVEVCAHSLVLFTVSTVLRGICNQAAPEAETTGRWRVPLCDSS